MTTPTRRRLVFICESGTDVRLVTGLKQRFELTLLLRPAFGPRTINWKDEGPEPVRIVEGPAGRVAFAAYAGAWLLRHRAEFDAVLAQNAGVASLAANVTRGVTRAPTYLLICSPNIAYFQCRYSRGEIGLPAYVAGRTLLEAARAANALLADRYLVLSDYLGREVSLGRTEKVRLVPLYGVDTSRFTPVSAEEKRRLRAKLGLPEEGFLIFFSSRVAPEKDTESLLDACALLRAQGRSFWMLNLSGGHKRLKELAMERGLGNCTLARDAVDPIRELPAYYQASDVCAQVSLEEGLGFSPLEALACEVPVVATSVGGLRETIVDGETGLSVPVRSPRRLAAALARVMDEPETFLAMARNGRRMVQERFEASRCFDAFAGLVEQELASRR
ncbi:glycosyltransferase family 4 protein [Archangium lipolyticum]|uniref:glycosyltransferase family 4 protein n=1 Tax=Archangium lipolyticum TaxID=2970465 RepID=UPI002149C539|nr:glycosyltransferase family 4 protein [Archangium lipolyticum]